MRSYRKNTLRSFLNYLKSEHEPDQYVSFDLHNAFANRIGKKGGMNVQVDITKLPKTIQEPKWINARFKNQSSKRKKNKKKERMEELLKDIEVGRDDVGRAANSSWWSWDAGSTLFFWRWPKWSKKSVRDGISLFVDWNRMPSFWKCQQWPTEEHSKAKLKKKLANVWSKKYVQPGFVKSLTSYFAVHSMWLE